MPNKSAGARMLSRSASVAPPLSKKATDDLGKVEFFKGYKTVEGEDPSDAARHLEWELMNLINGKGLYDPTRDIERMMRTILARTKWMKMG